MENVVDINYNDNEEMMSIMHNGKCLFYGNFWDFERDPESLAEFLQKLGITVNLSESDAEL